MKRKWFTLLFALLAVASFRVTAQPPVASPTCPDAANYWWVKVDTTGLALTGSNQLPYSGNKLSQPNWFIWDTSRTPDSTRINIDKSLIGEGDKALYSVNQVNDRMFNFIPKSNNPTPLQLTYAGNNWTQFEVVQFDSIDATTGLPVANPGGWGFTRTTQALTADGMEGYLMPAQGGQAASGILQKDSTASMLIVVSDANRNLSIRRFDEVFTSGSATNPVLTATLGNPAAGTPGTMLFTTFPTYNKSNPNFATNLTSVLNPALAAIGQAPLAAGSQQGGYDRALVYISVNYVGAHSPQLDPIDVTQYNGVLTDPAAIMGDASNWSNGLPANYLDQSGNATYANATLSAYGASLTQSSAFDYTNYVNSNQINGSLGLYAIVVQSQLTGTTTPATSTTFTGYSYTTNAIKYDWRPVYIKLERPAGRWATAADFGPGYYQFNGLSVATASDVQARTSKPTTYNTFAVTQVDWVAQGTTDNLGSNQSEGNIFGNPGETDATSGAAYYTPKFDPTLGGNDTTGLQMGGTVLNKGTDNIIPLFTLSSPESGCDVVSVSRENDLTVQSQAPGVYANKLELRAYGDYYDYWGAKGAWEVHHAKSTNLWDAQNTIANEAGQPVLQEDRVATSLQKFAIWIDVCGNMTLYPAASYSWIYGKDKTTQISTVSPNSVLLYNNINIAAAPGVAADADKGWGTQVGWWNGRNTNDTNDAYAWQVTTSPNKLTTSTDYQPLEFNPSPNNPNGQDIAGKFYFLEVQGVQTPAVTTPVEGPYFAKNAIQDATQTQYVLSTEVVYDAQGVGTKKLVMVPMEKVRRYADNTNKWYNDLLAYKAIEQADANGIVPAKAILPDYWSNNPYDSVNMAAHWEINKVAGGYQLVNMLGDVLQYNLDGTSNLAGGYLPVSSNISGNVSGAPLFNESGQWFAPNTKEPYINGTTQSVWTASALPGADASDLSFVLSLGNYTLNLGGWYPGTTKAWGDSTYYQQDVNLQTAATPALPLQIADYTCPNSLVLKTVPIYYVPNYSGSFNREDQTLGNTAATINTSDASFKDGQMVQDSLTAYLYLNGTYGIKEATAVDNSLLLGDTITDFLTTAGAARAAALTLNGGQNLQFIPMEQSGRNAAIQKAAGTTYATAAGIGVDTLYGETYKWFVVKKGDQYLRFDTINPNAQDARLKVAFTFQAGVENATPVRLYQPLVGDKLQGNFIFQFQIPYNRYDLAHNKVYVNSWPAIPGADANTTITNGTRVFGQLSNQSNYIQANADKAQATRFTYTFLKGNTTCCAQQFIDPDWMASQKLLGLPLQNQIWGLTPADSLGLGFYTGGTLDKVNTEATVQQGVTELKFTYVDSIRVAANGTNGVYSYKIGSNTYSVNSFATADLRTNGQSVVAVPLYYIQNEKGQYLTVSNVTYMFDAQSTATDVTGVNLIWVNANADGSAPYPYNSDPTKNTAALQLFAISGHETTDPADLVNGWYTDCQSYVYLPLASYKAAYNTGTVDNSVIYYNNGLGISGTSNCDYTNAPVNDVTQAFRVGYYSQIGKTQQNLAVLNASGSQLASAVPVASKWQKNTYDVLPCGDVLVENATNGAFYTSDGTICRADSNIIIAHWEANADANDKQLYTFAPEKLISETFTPASNGYADMSIAPTQLMGNYYFKITAQSGDTTTVNAYDFTNYNGNGTNKFKIGTSTYKIICVNHSLPYYNLEPEYELPAQLAILESTFTDRSLSDTTINQHVTPVWSDNSRIVYLNQNEGDDITKATYLTAYKTNVRRLATDVNADGTGHDIPYFAFSLKDGSKEYFLNVVPKEVNGVKDSLYWTLDADGSIAKQIQSDWANGDVNQGSKALSRYKFCLPYKVDQNGKLVAPVPYGSATYQPVYIQSMDTALNDAPYFVIVGAGSNLATVVRASDAVFSNPGVCGSTTSSLTKNIYSMDYAQVDPYQVTSWIFGGQMPSSTEWVPLKNELGQSPYLNPDLGTTDLSTDGLITKFQLTPDAGQGLTYITNSLQQPVMYGLLSGMSNGLLHFEYEGTEQIGTYAKVPIYYYRIQVPNQDSQWLTDSYGNTSTDYQYQFMGTPYQYAFFGPKLTTNVANKPYDSKYIQTFGLRYVDATKDPITIADGSIADQTFVVVANANYATSQESTYRYLAAVNGRLTFVSGKENAIAFQFGRENADGGFTGVQVVGTGEVFGVTGGVRLLNQAGSVANLYSVDGSLLKSVQVTGADQTVDAPRGIVIVKVADKATKVIVK